MNNSTNCDNIALIGSPFQLVCFNEYISKHKIEFQLYLFYNTKKEKEQLVNLCKLFNLNYTLIREVKVLQYFKIFRLAKRNSKSNIVLIGNLFSDVFLFFINSINFNSIILVDDGINSFEVQNLLSSNKKITPQSSFKKTFFDLFKINTNYPDKFEFFTVFNLPTNEKILYSKNSFDTLISLQSKDKSIQDCIFIIGQPLVEKKFISKDNYMKCLKLIYKSFPNHKIKYIPSRKEKSSLLKNISNTFNFEIYSAPYNIEIGYLLNKKPKKIIGFTSSALYTLTLLNEELKLNTKVQSYNISKYLNDSYKNRASLMYKKFDQKNIEIII